MNDSGSRRSLWTIKDGVHTVKLTGSATYLSSFVSSSALFGPLSSSTCSYERNRSLLQSRPCLASQTAPCRSSGEHLSTMCCSEPSLALRTGRLRSNRLRSSRFLRRSVQTSGSTDSVLPLFSSALRWSRLHRLYSGHLYNGHRQAPRQTTVHCRSRSTGCLSGEGTSPSFIQKILFFVQRKETDN